MGLKLLRSWLRALALGTALTVATIAPAQADPISGAIAAFTAFAAMPIGGFLTSIGLGFLAEGASTLLQSFLPKPALAPANVGVKLNLGRTGIDPQAFILGYHGTAGTLNYHGSWGQDGGTPNAYYTQEIIVSDLPVRELASAWATDTAIAIPDMSGDRPTPQGWPLTELRKDGQDYAWLYFRDGTQVAADPFLRAKFGGDPDRPYSDDMIGRGRAVVVVTIRVNEEVFPGRQAPRWIWVVPGIDLYNIAKDSTAGGSGAHRADDPSTWEPSSNLMVQAFNVLKGVYWGDEWLFGLQDSTLAELPASAWIAAINECDLAVPLAAGSTEPQFAGGLEVQVNTPAADVLDALLKGCAGRLAEIGGRYKPLVGLPPVPVYSFTDAEVVITRERSIDPFPAIDDTFNAAQGSYPEPSQGWAYKDAPPYRAPELEAEDGGQRMAPDLRFDAVYSGTQVQRLLKGSVIDGRNFRRPSLVLPPEASELEPLDAVAWTSASEGYADKAFLITQMSDEATYLAPVQLLETDPSAFDWNESTDERPMTLGLLTPRRPPPQVLVGFSMTPEVIPDATGAPRRPALTFGWDGGVDDVRAVGFEVRIATDDDDGALIYSDSTDNVAAGSLTVSSSAFLPDLAVQGRGIYYPRSARPTRWSNQDADGNDGPWLEAVLPNVLLDGSELANASLSAAKFQLDVQNQLGPTNVGLADRISQLELMLGDLADVVTDQSELHRTAIQGLAVANRSALAAITRVEQVAVTANSAVASLEERLTAQFGAIGADASYKAVVEVNELTGVSSLTWAVRATNGEFTGEAAWSIGASVGPDGATSFANLMADSINFITTAGSFVSTPFFVGVDPISGQSYSAIAELRTRHMTALDGTSFELDGGTDNDFSEPFLRVG